MHRDTLATEGLKYAGPVIDTDVHEIFTSLEDLVPYLKEPWRGLIVHKAWAGIGVPFAYWASAGVNRADSKPVTGAPAGSSYELFKEQVLDLYPIKFAILTGQFMPGNLEMQFEFASALASAYNDWVLEQWLTRDSRLLTSLHVAPQDPQAAAREIDRLGDYPRVVQVLLPIGQWAYGDPFYHPIFEAAQRHNLVIAMHHSGQVQSPFGRGRYYIEWHVNVPQGAMAMLTSLVCNGVFDKFPALQFAVIESGLSWLRLVEMLETDRMFVFATDYPHWDFDSPDESIPRALPADLKQRIFYENARELYGFDQG